ncbi:hypothetical protein [Streptomyces sp. NPDC057682]|uniref:hypothetical protein n=1 Tax=unclassified Streptomyces TaxID=2593676 RepID=UPI00365184A5
MRGYPYERLAGSVTFRVTAVELRGPGEIREPLDTRAFSTVEQVVALGLAERNDWETARLTLTAVIPGRASASDGPWTDIRVAVVLTEGATNARTTVCLEPGAEGGREWVGHLDLWRDDHLDRATMTVHVIATVGGVRGRVIAASDRDWIVDLKSDVPLRERELEVAQVGFREGPEWLRAFGDMPWTVDTSGEVPTVHVNSDFEGMADLIEGHGTATESLVRDLLHAQMCTDVWTAVFHTAIGDLEVEEDGTPLFPQDWRGEVLREMLPDVVPGRPLEDALRVVHTGRTGASGWTELQPLIHYAATRRADVPKVLTATIRGLDRLDRETDS